MSAKSNAIRSQMNVEIWFLCYFQRIFSATDFYLTSMDSGTG